MATKDVTLDIQGYPVFIRQWSALKSLENLEAGLKKFGPGFSNFLEGKADFVSFLRVLQHDELKTSELVLYITQARVDGAEVSVHDFGDFYKGRLFFAYEIFKAVCEVQYKDFFSQGLASVESPNLREKSQEKTSPKTSQA